MITIYQLKPKFQKLLMPLMRSLRKLGVTPNTLTIAAILLSAVMGVLLFKLPEIVRLVRHTEVLFLIPIGYLLRMMLNALDGMMATHYEMKSQRGEILNELGDVLSDLFILSGFAWFLFRDSWVGMFLVGLAIINEFAGILAKAVYGKRSYVGPMGKSDRALIVGLFFIALYLIPLFGDVDHYKAKTTFHVIGYGMMALMAWGTVRRLMKPK